MTVQPKGLTLQQWFDAVMLDNPSNWALGTLTDASDWQIHAAGFVRAPPLAQRALPDPYQFNDWREWAERVYPLLEGTR
jgi:hypothetical protein